MHNVSSFLDSDHTHFPPQYSMQVPFQGGKGGGGALVNNWFQKDGTLTLIIAILRESLTRKTQFPDLFRTNVAAFKGAAQIEKKDAAGTE